MQEQYNPADVEATAQAEWTAGKTFVVSENSPRPKYYACSMLPYPSGKLHMGHVRNYTINDVLARQMRMKGFNVLMPMGWDAFGLPAENAALASNKSPSEWTRQNIRDMKEQLSPLGLSIDWSREVATCDPDYYKWNQWFFLKMLEKGIAYKHTQVVNWDPVDKTVLANEQVINGRGWRSGALVERKEVPGYYFAITKYAEELLKDIDSLEGWPEMVRSMQRNWIGKSEGLSFSFHHKIRDEHGALIDGGRLGVFTTRPETLMGVTFCAIPPEHSIALRAMQLNPELASVIEQFKGTTTSEAHFSDIDQDGVYTGLTAEHPITGNSIPILVVNYLVAGYGTGAVMGVPAHDERDFSLARKKDIPIRQVIAFEGIEFDELRWDASYQSKDRGILINSGPFDGMELKEASEAVIDHLAIHGGEKKINWRLRDWGISRQRYWGTPIPMIYCEKCGDVPVPLKDLPVILPLDCIPDGSGNPLLKHPDFLRVDCPSCGSQARRETDTMDTFVDSSWYFMRYCEPGNEEAMVAEAAKYWMPMDHYIGGVEHAVLHLLYARFWTKAMRDEGLIDLNEPFKKLFTQGMLLRECFYREIDGGKRRWFYPSEVEVRLSSSGQPTETFAKEDGLPVSMGGIEKMSKSKNNVVEPREIIEKFGADTARLFTIFAGPPTQSIVWSDSGVEGAYRYLRRLWSFAFRHQGSIVMREQRGTLDERSAQLRFDIHSVLESVNKDYEKLHYNTIVSGAMKILNLLESEKSASSFVIREGLEILLKIINPITPHIAHVLWKALGFGKDILESQWPVPSTDVLTRSKLNLVVQVNGKLRGEIVVSSTASREEIEACALRDESIARFLEGSPKKIIIVPGRLVNIVI
ncbi:MULTISPECIES: leucine--tRNA ligase [Pseudomonas syringae group]|nr:MULTISPECIES: leucine--tRNA ligase [Pseudomonas syringae group]AVB23291.1 leucine--tRNA ligase [Pseudomonas avellanae]KWS71690.1 leucine--tRNA ligase [Pseudomonas amygdali pv. morsprunorum]KWS89617.1 leucine--tRNA ligase [Pseudomonas syringae pv. castaneae]PHN35712.1 leucine--tRNA ligase [Pseudomonas avellanae]POC82467.1 leucine--tRNA ligase [Pseudomonas avellanae]